MKKANYISAVIAALAVAGSIYAYDYYVDDVAHFVKYIYQFVFFGIGVLVLDFVRLRNQKK